MNRSGQVLLLFFSMLIAATGIAQPKDLQVVVASPKGVTATPDQSQGVFVTFKQPMVPLQAVSFQEGAAVMQIQPAIPGKYRWMGTTTLAFVPASPLPNGTLFAVKIPAGTKSLSGQMLSAEYEWDFETPRPQITSADPPMRQRFVELDHSIQR